MKKNKITDFIINNSFVSISYLFFTRLYFLSPEFIYIWFTFQRFLLIIALSPLHVQQIKVSPRLRLGFVCFTMTRLISPLFPFRKWFFCTLIYLLMNFDLIFRHLIYPWAKLYYSLLYSVHWFWFCAVLSLPLQTVKRKINVTLAHLLNQTKWEKKIIKLRTHIF